MNVTELRPGNYFIDNDQLLLVMDILLNKTAMRKMVAKVKVKNVRTGAITEMSANSGYQVETIRLDKKKMSYLYDDGNFLVFMDQETYDQVNIEKNRLEWEINFLKANQEIDVVQYENEILGIALPAKVDLMVTECEPAVRGDTVNKAMKNAILETGWKVRVPMFINEGESVQVRTDNGEYDGRSTGV